MPVDPAVELRISIGSEYDDEAQVDHATRDLLNDLRKTIDVEQAVLATEEQSKPGAKAAETVIIGSIGVAVVTKLIPALLQFLIEWKKLRIKEKYTVEISRGYSQKTVAFILPDNPSEAKDLMEGVMSAPEQ